MIGRTNVGGGAGLNFKVVGNPQPSNPKENTIWINTDAKITSWVFSNNLPTGKNLLENTATSSIINGVSYSVNADGSVAVNGTANGGVSDFYIWGQQVDKGNYLHIPKGSIISGFGSAASGAFVIAREKTRGAILNHNEINKALAESDCYFYGILFRVTEGYTVSNLTLYPMIRLASETDDTYDPYCGIIPEGMVGISTGTYSTVAFNALKKNGIQVYPISAMQYEGGAWVDKTAKSYQDGAWVDWWNGELFDNGNQYEAVTGGWRSVGAKSYYAAQAPSLTFSNGKMVVSQASGKSGLVSPAKLIDISKFSSLQIVVDSMSGALNARFYKTLSPSDGDGENIGLAQLAVGTNDVPLPTTSPVCVSLFASSGVSGTISSVKLIP